MIFKNFFQMPSLILFLSETFQVEQDKRIAYLEEDIRTPEVKRQAQGYTIW